MTSSTKATKRNALAVDGVFGAVPANANFFSAKGRDGNAWRRLRHPAENGVEITEFPLTDARVETLRERWGAGEYRLSWLEVKGGNRRALGHSPVIHLRENPAPTVATVASPAAATTASASAAQSTGEAVDSLVALWQLAQTQASTWAREHQAHAERTIERERGFFAMQLEQQRTFFNELDRLRRENAPPPPASGAASDAVLGALKSISKKLETMGEGGADEDAVVDASTLDKLNTLATNVMPHLGPAFGEGLGALLGATAEWMQARTKKAAESKPTPEPKLTAAEPRAAAPASQSHPKPIVHRVHPIVHDIPPLDPNANPTQTAQKPSAKQ